MATTTHLNITLLEQYQTGAEITVNGALSLLDVFSSRLVITDRISAEPVSPTDGQAWILTSSPTGAAWGARSEHDVAVYLSGWYFVTPTEGSLRAYVLDENREYMFDGTIWTAEYKGHLVMDANAFMQHSITGSITASTTQTQGQGALLSGVNDVTTVANTNDTVTLPNGANGRECYVWNNGANTLQIFPTSGEAIDGNATDAAVTLPAGSERHFIATSSTTWISKVSTIGT